MFYMTGQLGNKGGCLSHFHWNKIKSISRPCELAAMELPKARQVFFPKNQYNLSIRKSTKIDVVVDRIHNRCSNNDTSSLQIF